MCDLPSPSTGAFTYHEATPPLDPNQQPTWVRYRVLAFLAAMTFVLYLDRSCINQAAPIIKNELGISEGQKGIIFGAFTLAYAVFEIPAGRWGDRYGSRRILTRIVLWWSFFTALTGAAWGFGSLVVIRFLFGAGEAGALPNSARVLRAWFPESSRGRAQGIVTTAMLLGGAASYTSSQWLIDRVGWRWSFAVFALLGVGWALAFYLWFRDDPAEHVGTNEAERRLITAGRMPHRSVGVSEEGQAAGLAAGRGDVHGPIPWDRVAGCANIWLLSAIMMTMSAMHELLASWYPTYLQEARGASQDLSGNLTTLVLFPGAVAAFFGGFLTDWLVRKTGSRRWGRTAQAVVGAGLSAFGILASIWTDSTNLASAFIALVAFGVQLQLPSWWACATQVSGRHLGALFGLMNMMGGAGRMLSQLFVGYFADWRKSLGYTGRAQWDPSLYIYVAIALIGLTLWALVNPEKTVDSQKPKPAGLDADLP
jgi:MFS transporter, ACS family, glucarate transporter